MRMVRWMPADSASNASVFSDLYSDKTTVYTGNPESAGKDGRVETVYDEGICEGVRVVRGNRMFDYSI